MAGSACAIASRSFANQEILMSMSVKKGKEKEEEREKEKEAKGKKGRWGRDKGEGE